VHSSDQGSSWKQYAYVGNELSRVPRDILVDQTGTVWLLWISVDDDFSPSFVNISKSIDSGKTFSLVFRSLSYSDGFLYQKLAVDGQNSIYLLWDDFQFKLTRFRNGDIQQRYDAPISTDSFQIGQHLSLVVSRDFIVHIAWEGISSDSTGYHDFIFYTQSIDTGNSFIGRTLVDTADNPSLTTDSLGRIYVSFRKLSSTNPLGLFIAKSSNGGISFDESIYISDTIYSWSGICTDSEGGIDVLWNAPYGARYSRSSDGGATFSPFVHVGYLGMLDVKAGTNGYLYAIGANDSGVVFTRKNVILSVSDIDKKPREFRLSANYPNPFNSSTTIRISLAKSEYVDVKVFDILGKEVSSLIVGRLDSGEHSLTWNAQGLASGVYFARLAVGRKLAVTQKMILSR